VRADRAGCHPPGFQGSAETLVIWNSGSTCLAAHQGDSNGRLAGRDTGTGGPARRSDLYFFEDISEEEFIAALQHSGGSWFSRNMRVFRRPRRLSKPFPRAAQERSAGSCGRSPGEPGQRDGEIITRSWSWQAGSRPISCRSGAIALAGRLPPGWSQPSGPRVILRFYPTGK
jgi:hypothetical protein